MTRSVLLLMLSACIRVGASDSDFYAYYTKVRTDESFERSSRTCEHPDIVINLGHVKGRFVFWRGSSYLPYWETAG